MPTFQIQEILRIETGTELDRSGVYTVPTDYSIAAFGVTHGFPPGMMGARVPSWIV